MKVVLKKHTDGRFSLSHKESGWWIGDSDHDKVKTHKGEQILSKLSLKNCEAIANGYDLDELADIRAEILNSYTSGTKWVSDIDKLLTRYREVVELLGDKKFSEEDLRRAFNCNHLSSTEKEEHWSTFFQSLQQTEWEVEIEMWFHGTRHKKGEWIPKLDADGCLILRRI